MSHMQSLWFLFNFSGFSIDFSCMLLPIITLTLAIHSNESFHFAVILIHCSFHSEANCWFQSFDIHSQYVRCCFHWNAAIEINNWHFTYFLSIIKQAHWPFPPCLQIFGWIVWMKCAQAFSSAFFLLILALIWISKERVSAICKMYALQLNLIKFESISSYKFHSNGVWSL